MMGGLFENFNEDTFVDEADQFDTLKETEISKVFNQTLENCRLSYIEVLSTSLKLNFEQLYIEVLKEILYSIQDPPHQNFFIEFAQDVFKIDKTFHDKILKSIITKEVPTCVLNIEIIKGEILESEINEINLNNPFCILYLSSNPQNKFNTSFKNQTLHPVWEEHFSIPLENSLDSILFMEMWDFIPNEIIQKNITKSIISKQMKALKRALKNIVQTTTFSRQEKKPIACTEIFLKTISSIGFTEAWYNLKNHSGKQVGKLLVKMSFGRNKKKQVSTQEHRQLLRVLLNYQINKHNIQTNSWDGNFLIESDIIIKKHIAYCNINSKEEYLDKWIEFIDIHFQNPVIRFNVFLGILNNLVKPLTQGELSDYELKVFWQSTKKMLPFCYTVIRTIRSTSPEDEQLLDDIECILNVLHILQSLDVPHYVDLFSSDIYDWLSPYKRTRDIRSTLQDAVIQAAQDWVVHILDNNRPQYETEEEELKFQFKMIQLLKLDLQKAVEFHNKLFVEKMQFPYVSTIFTVYESKIAEKCETFVKCVLMNMKPIKFNEIEQFQIDDDPLTTGRLLFTLYIGIQKFLEFGMNNVDIDFNKSCLIEYHKWFQKGVSKWLDIATYKAIQRIDKAIELDKLVKIDSSSEFSSSAVDTLTIFYEMKTFWQQLAWPDIEGSYFFMIKIIDDISKYSLHYSDKMGHKICHTMNGIRKIEVTKEWCLAVNNVEYIKRSIRIFVNDSNIVELIENLANSKSEVEARRCKRTLDSIIDNTIDSLNEKIENILRVVTNKMTPCISTFLNEGTEVTQKNNKYLDNLLHYLDENLSILSEELSEKNFEHIFDIIIESIGNLMFNVVNTNLKKMKRHSYFRNLRDNFHILFGFLKNGKDIEYKSEKIQELEKLLNLHAMDTINLIDQYYLQKIQEQKEMPESTEGVLTVKLAFIENDLKIEILNAYHLKAMDSSGFSDPFVTVVLLPQYRFQNIINPRTAVQKKTLSPLFDAFFKISLTPEQRCDKNGIVMFIMEDEDFMGLKNEFMCETFMHFKDIPSVQFESDLENLPQIKLNMTVPQSLDTSILKVLNNRTKEKLAKDFIKQVKIKMPASNCG